MSFYCGNNAKAPEIVSRRKRIGTAYECFRRGVGVGKNLPAEEGEYEAIYSPNIFCGKKFGPEQKKKYERMGSPSECLRKGVGVGKSLTRKVKENSFSKPKFSFFDTRPTSPKETIKKYPGEKTSESVPKNLQLKSSEDILKQKFQFESSKNPVWPKRFILLGIGFAIGFVISFTILWFIKPKFIKTSEKRSILKITLYSLLLGFILALLFLVGSLYLLK
jgi:hypothetical protein